MDDLNKPLGQKEEKPSQAGSKSDSAFTGTMLALAALVVATAALGLIGWQVFRTPETPPTLTADTSGQEVAVGTSKSELDVKPDTTSDSDGGTQLADEETSGETGMVELTTDGRLAVPKPRPPKAAPQDIGLAHLPDPELIERGATGVIPKRSSDGRRPMDVYAREADTTGNFGVARVVIIVGGIGVSQTTSQQAIRDLPPNVVLAFAPSGNSLTRWMQAARRKGHELLLQVPMEPFGFPQNTPGPRTLVSDVSAEENLANLHWAMSRITNYVGVMNYQGAKMLAEPRSLKPVFDDIADRGLLFIDDGSANGSRSKLAAAGSVLPYAAASIQIDIKRSRREIANQIDALVTEAKRTGMAIGVANAFNDSIRMIAEFAAQANRLGVEITPVSAVVNDPERGN